MRLITSDVINTIQIALIADAVRFLKPFDVFLFYRFSMSGVDQKLGVGLKIGHFESDFEMIKLAIY